MILPRKTHLSKFDKIDKMKSQKITLSIIQFLISLRAFGLAVGFDQLALDIAVREKIVPGIAALQDDNSQSCKEETPFVNQYECKTATIDESPDGKKNKEPISIPLLI